MPLFTPPTTDVRAWGDIDSDNGTDRVTAYWDPQQQGQTVHQDQDDVWHTSLYPYHGSKHRTFFHGQLTSSTSAPGLRDAKQVFLGGHDHQVTSTQADELTAAGFGEYLNTRTPIYLTWTKQETLLLTDQVMTTVAPNTPLPPQIGRHLSGVFQLDVGEENLSNRRDFWLHDHTSGWTDTHVKVDLINPRFFAVHPLLGNVFPQAGVCLRVQNNAGVVTGVTLNNNIFLGLPGLNVGVWRANEDGTAFTNRQFGWPVFESLPMPYGFEATLIDNVVTVRIFADPLNPPPWDHPEHARVIDLDTDAGNAAAVPTPTGAGQNGIIAAHVGTDPLAVARLSAVRFERLDTP